MPHQVCDVGHGLFLLVNNVRGLLPLFSLQILWAGATLARSMGEPPLDTGTISSTSKLHGSPAGSA